MTVTPEQFKNAVRQGANYRNAQFDGLTETEKDDLAGEVFNEDRSAYKHKVAAEKAKAIAKSNADGVKTRVVRHAKANPQ